MKNLISLSIVEFDLIHLVNMFYNFSRAKKCNSFFNFPSFFAPLRCVCVFGFLPLYFPSVGHTGVFG